MSTYRELRNEKNELIVIEKGFNVPAMLVAPLWALTKQFWPAVAVTLAVSMVIKFAMAAAYEADLIAMYYAFYVALLGLAILFGYYANMLLAAYHISKGWRLVGYIEADNADIATNIANDPKRDKNKSQSGQL